MKIVIDSDRLIKLLTKIYGNNFPKIAMAMDELDANVNPKFEICTVNLHTWVEGKCAHCGKKLEYAV